MKKINKALVHFAMSAAVVIFFIIAAHGHSFAKMTKEQYEDFLNYTNAWWLLPNGQIALAVYYDKKEEILYFTKNTVHRHGPDITRQGMKEMALPVEPVLFLWTPGTDGYIVFLHPEAYMRAEASISEIRRKGLFFVKIPWKECTDFTLSAEHERHYRIFDDVLPYPVTYRRK